MTKDKEITSTLMDFYNKPVARVSLELFLSILAVIFFALFAIKPTLETMTSLIKELEDKKELDLQLGQKIASLASVQSQYLASKNELVVLDEALPSSPELIKTLKIIEKVASETKLVITSLKISELPPEKPNQTSTSGKFVKKSYHSSVTVEGDYQSIREFVERIQLSRKVLVTEAIDFSLSDSQGTKRLIATITISSHYFSSQP